jgi:hypothetical protein
MNNLILFLTLNFISPQDSTCKCPEIDTILTVNFYSRFDYLIVGKRIDRKIWSQEMKKHLEDFSIETAIIKVDSVIKGDIKSDYIILTQFDDDCNQSFTLNQPYLILGSRIESIASTPKPKPNSMEELSIRFDPTTNILSIREATNDFIDNWNKKSKENLFIVTHKCVLFKLMSNEGKKLINYGVQH